MLFDGIPYAPNVRQQHLGQSGTARCFPKDPRQPDFMKVNGAVRAHYRGILLRHDRHTQSGVSPAGWFGLGRWTEDS